LYAKLQLAAIAIAIVRCNVCPHSTDLYRSMPVLRCFRCCFEYTTYICLRIQILRVIAKFRSNQTIVDVLSIFSRWPPAAILDLIWVMLDYTRSAIAGPQNWSWFDPIYSFGDIVIFIFCRFGLKLLIHAHFLGVLGEYFSIVLTNPQPHFCADIRRLGHKVWKSVTLGTWA